MHKELLVLWAGIVLAYMLSRVNIYISLTYRRQDSDDHIIVDVFLLRKLIHYTITIPVIKTIDRTGIVWPVSEIETANGDVHTHAERERRFIQNLWYIYLHYPRKFRRMLRQLRLFMRLYKTFARKVLASLYCERLYWKTTFGSEDAAVTGVTVGALWAVKGLAYHAVRQRVKFSKRPEFAVVPVFGRQRFEVEFQCIFRLRVGNVITATYSLFKSKRKGAVGSG